MTAPTEEGRRVNGTESPAAEPTRAPAARYPYLQAFAAGGVSHDNGRTMSGYRMRFGIALGLSVGRTLDLEIPRAIHAARLAQLLEDTAKALRYAVKECEEHGGAEGLPAAKEGAPVTAEVIAHGPCPRCQSRDPDRLASCRVPACPIAAGRAAMPIMAAGALAAASLGKAAPSDANTVTVASPEAAAANGEAEDTAEG